MLAAAVVLVLEGLALAADQAVTKVWVESRDPRTVWGRFQANPSVVLFDDKVKTERGFAFPAGWKLSAYSLPSLSPDGRRVAFKAAAGDSSAVGIFQVESGAARILDTDCDARAVSWSPAGRHVAVEDSRGLLNNALRVLVHGKESSQLEISGDVLADLGYEDYRFKSDRDGGLDIWRTEVYEARWTSESRLVFKLKRVHVTAGGDSKPQVAEQTQPEDWSFDLTSKKLAKL